MEQMLPSSQFIRVHRSFIVSKSKIREIDRARIVFGDVYIPIGDSYKQTFQDFLNSKTK
jgi:DNA-binding LytR/AlgR family response regulator